MIKEIKNFKRMDIFNHYNECDNPFLILTTPVDITELVKYSKIHKKFYGTMGYAVMMAVNKVDAFKYRYKDNKIYYCEPIRANYTQKLYDDIGYFPVKYNENYSEYIKDFINTENKFYKEEKYIQYDDLAEIWTSCAPWFKFNSLVPPINKKVSIPQIIWDKYELKDGRYYIDIMIMIHHGFADGYHINLFLEELNKIIKNFESYE